MKKNNLFTEWYELPMNFRPKIRYWDLTYLTPSAISTMYNVRAQLPISIHAKAISNMQM